MPDELLATTTIQNGSMEIPFEFYLKHEMEDALHEIIGQDITPEAYFKIFDKYGGFQKYRDIIISFFKNFIINYGAFPSKETPAEKITINFKFGSSGGGCTSTTDGKKIFIRLGTTESSLINIERILYHETLHFVSQLKHDESIMTKQLQEQQDAYMRAITFSNKEFNDDINVILTTVSKFTSLSAETDYLVAQLLKLPKLFFLYLKKFNNVLADVGLIIISIEKGNMIEYQDYINDAKSGLSNFFINYQYIKKLAEPMEEKKFLEIAYEFDENKLKQLLRFLIFCSAIINYPWFIAPYAKLGTKWEHNQPVKPDTEAQKILTEYKNHISQIKSIKDRLTRIFAAYESLIDYHRIRNDPYDKDLQHKVHDSGAIQLANQTLNILMQEFREFCEENKAEQFFEI